jgi:hypothetical protein
LRRYITELEMIVAEKRRENYFLQNGSLGTITEDSNGRLSAISDALESDGYDTEFEAKPMRNLLDTSPIEDLSAADTQTGAHLRTNNTTLAPSHSLFSLCEAANANMVLVSPGAVSPEPTATPRAGGQPELTFDAATRYLVGYTHSDYDQFIPASDDRFTYVRLESEPVQTPQASDCIQIAFQLPGSQSPSEEPLVGSLVDTDFLVMGQGAPRDGTSNI